MTRPLSLAAAAAALVGSALLLTPFAAHAQAPAADYYTATPVAKPGKTSVITRSTVWKLRDTAYVANKAPEREIVLCELVAQRVGTLSAFTVAGQAFDADALAKCNARAK